LIYTDLSPACLRYTLREVDTENSRHSLSMPWRGIWR
jgi:hypothetical protein